MYYALSTVNHAMGQFYLLTFVPNYKNKEFLCEIYDFVKVLPTILLQWQLEYKSEQNTKVKNEGVVLLVVTAR